MPVSTTVVEGGTILCFHSCIRRGYLIFGGNIRLIDSSLERKDTTKKLIEDKEQLGDFLESHCKIRHYMFSVKKCGSADCNICKVPHLPADVFNDIHHLPDPIPDGDKYKSFEDVYGSQTSEKHHPSLSTPGVKKNMECHFPLQLNMQEM